MIIWQNRIRYLPWLLVLLGVAALFFKRTDTEIAVGRSLSIKNTDEVISQGNVVVRMTKNGFEPEEIKIKKGQTIIWVNEDADFHWPASNLHPTHEIYTEFDSRKPLAPGKRWVFTFDKAGEWRCHDHLNPRLRCIVRVEK